MKASLLSAVCLLPLAACAGYTHRLEAGPLFVRPSGDAALQNVAGNLALGAERNSLGELGVDDTETAPNVALTVIGDRHRVRARGFWFEGNGTGTLAGDFGDLASGTAVSTALDVVSVHGAYTYEMHRDDDWRWGLCGALSYTQIDYLVASTTSSEDLAVDVIMPMPVVEAEWFLGDLSLAGTAGLMQARVGDNDSLVIDLEALARWRVMPELELQGGYRYLRIDGDGNAEGREYQADLELQGLFVGAVLRF